MNKRAYLWAGGVLMGLIVLTKTPLVFSLFALLILGVVPGTSLVIPAWILLVIYPILFAATLFWLSARPIMITESHPAPVNVRKKTLSAKKKISKSTTRKTSPTKRRARATV